MRHRKRGRVLGRSSSHRKAMLRNLASAIFLTEREPDEYDGNTPKKSGRIITTLAKAKEVRSLVEKSITVARRVLEIRDEAERLHPAPRDLAERSKWRKGDAFTAWRKSADWAKWNDKARHVVAARRRALQMLGSKEAVEILFDVVAPRFADRPGGYTRILKLAKPRLGDAGDRAILEFVGEHDRAPQTTAPAPTIEADK